GGGTPAGQDRGLPQPARVAPPGWRRGVERVPQVEQEHQERRPDEPGDSHRAYRGGPDRDRHGVARGGPGRVASVGQAQRRRPIAEEASDDRVGDGEEREVAERERRDRSARLLEAGQAAGYD